MLYKTGIDYLSIRCKKIKKHHWFSFVLICFDLIQIFRDIASLSFQVSWGHQFLIEVKKFLGFGIFQLGLSNFWIGAWFPFDVFELFNISLMSLFQNEILGEEETKRKVRHAVSIITFSLCLASVILLLVALGIFTFFK